jgi:hypothetical protein
MESESCDSSSDEEEYETLAQLARKPKAAYLQSLSLSSSEDEEDEVDKEVEFSDHGGDMEG